MRRFDHSGGDGMADSAPPARVAYIMSRFPKLTETFVLYEIVALEAMGITVDVYPLLRETQPVEQLEAAAWARRARFHPFLSLPILRAHAHFIRRRPGSYFRLWAEVLGRTWGSANFFLGALGILPKAVRFAYEMKRQGVTHVHAHFASHPAVAALVVHRLTEIPFSFTAHGSDLHVDRRMLDVKVMAAAFVVAVSEYNRDLIVAECGESVREKVHVIHCGVDAGIFAPPVIPRSGDPFQIVCVASLEEVKGHRFLVESCRLLSERGVDFLCHLVGDGPLRREVAGQIARSALEGRVLLHGGKPRAVVAELLARSDAAVLASHPTPRGKREGIPVALMEAMASGLPVVASAISGIPELVSSGETGILVPSGDPVALADALQKLASDPELRTRLGRSATDKVRRDFDLHSNAAELLERFLSVRRARRQEGGRIARDDSGSPAWSQTGAESISHG